MEKTFDKKVIYITGASAEIGYGTAELCLRKGAKVIITGRNQENLENIQKAFNHRAKMNGLSSKGEWSEELEKETAA